MSVSLAEDLDSVAALGAVGWGDRGHVRDVLAATLVKKQAQRTTFDALFDVYFPALVGDGVRGAGGAGDAATASRPTPQGSGTTPPRCRRSVTSSPRRSRAATTSSCGELAAQMVGIFGAMPGRGPGPVVLVGLHRAPAGGARRS